jgi:hypothetical protein
MDLNTFFVTVFCTIDDWLKGKRLRQRGPRPVLYDSEVLTMEVVGEFLGMDEDKSIYTYFRRHWTEWFPRIARVHRTTFVRQAANLWSVKHALWQHVLEQVSMDREVSIVDSFPVAMCWPGGIVAVELTPANVHDLTAVEQLTHPSTGWLLGDRNYWSPKLAARLAEKQIPLLARYWSAKRDTQPWPLWLTHTRYRIETVFSQLVNRFNAKTVWTRDTWHLTSRWWRKILAHTFAVFVAQQRDLDSPLRFADLITD